MSKEELFLEEIKKSAAAIYSEDKLLEKFKSGKKLKIKLGCDPSRPDLHLGHTVVLRALKKFQERGDEVIFLIGDYTGMIGDPTGKNKTRPGLTHEETRKSGQTYFEQVTKILDKNKTKIVYNSEWLSKLSFADVLKLTSRYTLARLMERDDFSNRFKEGIPICVHELLYPLMQGYDSVALGCDIEIGGTDQTFNCLVGKALMPDYGLEAQEVIVFPLLKGLDGKNKMSKSLDNYIGISEPAEVIFEKCMRVPDELLEEYFALTTSVPAEIYKKLLKDIREAHFAYAEEIVRMYHGEDAVKAAKERYLSVAGGGLPENIKEFKAGSKEITLVDALVLSKLAESKSQARNLILGNGVKVNNERVNDITAVLNLEKEIIISKGKNNFAKVIF